MATPQTWAPGAAGTSFGVSVATTAASAETEIRTAANAAAPCEVTLKAAISTAAAAQISGFTLAFGVAGMAPPTDADMLLDPVDGWVQFTIPAGVTHIRIKSPAAGGAAGRVVGYLSGRPG